MLQCEKEKLKKDKIEDKDEESWNNILTFLDSSYTGKVNKKVKPKITPYQQRNVLT